MESASPPRPETEHPTVVSRPPHQDHDVGSRLPWVIVGLALVLAGIGALFVSGAYDEPLQARAVGQNLAVNDGADNPLDLSAHNSPTLVRNPVDAANLVIANRIDSPSYSCALHVSFDGGGRWTQTAIPAPRGRRVKACYAPDAVFDADGTLYVSYVTLKGRANSPDAVWLTRSSDGGKTLTDPVETPLPERSFQVRLTADPAEPRRIYLTWLEASELGLYRFTEPGNPIRAIRSEDGGGTWGEPVTVSGSDRERVVAPSPAAGPEGELYVLYLDLGEDVLDYEGGHRGRGGPAYPGFWQLVLARSTDRGEKWQESVVEDELTPTERFIVFTPPFPSLAVDQDSGQIYAAFQDGRTGDADVRLWSLARGDERWRGPARVNDTKPEDGTAQYLPELAVAPDGRLDVMYYDRRADPSDVLNEVSYQYSEDEGESFSERIRLSDRQFSSRIGFGLERGLPDLGSRLGLISDDRRAYGVWTDTRAGSRRTAKQDIARGLVAFNDPARLSDGVKTLLQIGGIALIVLGIGVAVLLGLRPRRAR